MEIDVGEYINKDIKNQSSRPLLPIYEAISNSLHAEAKKIEIIIERHNNARLIESSTFNKIKNIIIADNGVGFNESNYNSFNLAYTSNKELGKGKGRFFYLKNFKKVKIKSIYKENDDYYERNFDFLPTKNGIENSSNPQKIEKQNKKTEVRLEGLDNNVEFPTKLEDIAFDITVHFFLEFRKNKNFNIIIKDIERKENYDLRKLFDEKLGDEIQIIDFKIENVSFKIEHLLIEKLGEVNASTVFLTAENRIVKDEKFKNSYFNSPFDEKYVYAFISSPYLDERVNTNRTNFIFDSQGVIGRTHNEYFDINVILNEVSKNIEEIYSSYIEDIKNRRDLRIRNYLDNSINSSDKLIYDAYKNDILQNVKEGSQNSSIAKIIDEKKREIKEQTVEDIKKININNENYNERITEISEKIEINMKHALAEYVIQRKMTLEVYGKVLEGKKSGIDKKTGTSIQHNYEHEKSIHNLIFPMKKNNLETDYNEHNLWLIDDSLSFQTFITSDLAMGKFIKNSEDKSRPDILLFSEYDKNSFIDSMTIIELKRPEIDPQKRKDSPHTQVISYVKKLRNKEFLVNGKELKTDSDRTRFYVYILMDLNKSAKDYFEQEDYIELRVGKGYYKYHQQYNTHIQVLDYRTLGEDATRRNNAFFEKLGISSEKLLENQD